MKRFLMISITLFSLFTTLFAQHTYFWSEKEISFQSETEFHTTQTPFNIKFTQNGIHIVVDIISGMEGVSDLSWSLGSYASTFDYQADGPAQSFPVSDAVKASMLTANKDGKNIMLVMFSDVELTQCYLMEAEYDLPLKNQVISFMQSVAFQAPNTIEKPNDLANTNEEIIDTPFHLEKVANFTLENSTGGQSSLYDFRGKTVLLDFWGTWCHPCIEEIPKLVDLYKTYGGDDFEILGIAFDSNPGKWEKMLLDQEMTWPNVIDRSGDIQKKFQISSYPTLILIDPQGDIIQKDIHIDEVITYLSADTQSTPQLSADTLPFQDTEIQKTTWSLLEQYSKDGFHILQEFYLAPSGTTDFWISNLDTDFTKWIDGSTEWEIMKSLGTVVHEMCHGYTSKLWIKWMLDGGYDLDYHQTFSAFYHQDKQMTVVEHTKVFPTKNIHHIYPKEMITFRYDTYVYPSDPDLGTQVEGIYGLLDELNAYYQGAKCEYELAAFYENTVTEAEEWTEYFSTFYSEYYAFLEFKSYILTYLLYAQEHYPDIFKNIMANAEFRQALHITDNNWQTLIQNFVDKRSEIFSRLSQNGHQIIEDEDFMYINHKGVGHFKPRYQKLKSGLEAPAYQNIAAELGLTSSSGPNIY